MTGKIMLGVAALGLGGLALLATRKASAASGGSFAPSGGTAKAQERAAEARGEGGYIIAPGDNPWNLAIEYTGEGRRYIELRAANPKKTWDTKAANFKFFPAGERIQLPASWL